MKKERNILIKIFDPTKGELDPIVILIIEEKNWKRKDLQPDFNIIK